jgi:phosphohistidine phosphatase
MPLKRLHLLRHAKSSWDSPDIDDHDRPLAERGLRTAPRVADYLVGHGLRPGLVLCSTAARARQTFDALAPGLDGVPVLYERAVYVFQGKALLDRLRTLPEAVAEVLVVGHNPALEEVIVALADPAVAGPLASLREKFPTGAYAALRTEVAWADLKPHCAVLEAFVRPKDLKADDSGRPAPA